MTETQNNRDKEREREDEESEDNSNMDDASAIKGIHLMPLMYCNIKNLNLL